MQIYCQLFNVFLSIHFAPIDATAEGCRSVALLLTFFLTCCLTLASTTRYILKVLKTQFFQILFHNLVFVKLLIIKLFQVFI